MARPQNVRERERARQRARHAALQERQAAARRQRKVMALVGLVLVLALVAGFFGVRSGDDTRASSDSPEEPSVDPTAASTVPATGDAELTFPPPGESITGETPCPADDGSAPRVTSFAGAPPVCIDPAMLYEATIRTSKGELKLLLNPEQAPDAVNNFVVLSRYHYYDGQPFTVIKSRESAYVAARFDGDQSAPGYTLPGEAPPTIWAPGSIGMVPAGGDTTAYGASFLIATFEMAAGLPENLTQFGIMLDGHPTLVAIERAASESGRPIEEVVIESISVRAATPAD
jgi:cyclophilin family peptidyl-prolyl cis-trans isomerase